MIGSYLIKNRFYLIKLIKNKKQVVPAIEAFDNKFITPENFNNDSLPNLSRLRPYYAKNYEEMFCSKAPFCDIDCQDCFNLENDDKYWENCDIGFACGKPNNIVVIDNDTGMPLEEFKKWMKKNYGELPDTWISQTGSGGHHFYYYYPHAFKSDINRFIQGVDFIGCNRWVMLPPFKTSKGNYKWIVPPSDRISKLPSWVLNLSVSQIKKQPVSNIPIQIKSSDHERVAKILSMWPISIVNHDDWLKVGLSLIGNGMGDLFFSWSSNDSQSRLYSSSQKSWLERHSEGTDIGLFFNVAKENGFTLMK